MSSRMVSSAVAVGLFVALITVAVLTPVPFVVFEPGPTVDVLAEQEGEELISVSGHPTYRDEGEIRFTTVSVTGPTQDINIFAALSAWWDDEQAIYPRDVIYPDDQSADEIRRDSSVQMVSSQDTAIANAMRAMGETVPSVTEILNVVTGGPSDGALKVRDQVLAVDGARVASASDVAALVQKTEPGTEIELRIRRDGKRYTIPVTTGESPDEPGRSIIGVIVGPGYKLPYDVRVNVDENIGGPSAGLMFALAVYDTLTPGSLTEGKTIAGTGSIDDRGRVGPIGGIGQKIVGAGASGAGLFMVPPGNCEAALVAPEQDGMRLVKARTFKTALAAVQAWTDDPQAALPSCD